MRSFRKRKNLLACIGLAVFFLIQNHRMKAQVLELQNLPASTKWRQMNTDNFQVIFPEGFESEANRTMNILEAVKEPASKSLYKKVKKYSVILQNKQGFSNGFVGIAPRRSEFFTIYSQDYNFVGNSDWIELLAVHEYRHMVQFSKTYSTGFNKLNYWLFGEYGLGAWSGLAAPSWFWEGDAVGIETSMTASGRGRLPWFSLAYKTNLLEKGAFNYSKQSLRSFKDFVPNHYRTGYFMTTYLKSKHGVDVWDKIIHRSFQTPFIPFAFSNAIKKVTGKNLRQTYEEMTDELKDLYSEQVLNIKVENRQIVNKRNNQVYTNYFYPTQTSDGKVIVLKSGFSDIPTFVSIDEKGDEKTVFTPGIFNDPGLLSMRSDKMVWVEFEFDTRWSKQSYSVIKFYDLISKTQKILSHKSRYTSVALSPDGKLIAAIHNSENNKHTIHLINASDGSLVKAFENVENAFYSMPSFSNDGKNLVTLKLIDRVKSIVIKDLDSNNEEMLISSETENFGHPVFYEDYVFYNSAANGIDNIYALKRTSKEVFQITHVKYGSYNPSISKDGKTMYYNTFSKDGMDVAQAPIDISNWKPLAQVENLNFNYQASMVEEEGISDVLKNRTNKVYETKKYNQLKSLIRPFAWGLTSVVEDNYTLGISSTDVLNTTSISAGVIFNSNERNTRRFINISYQGFYPILDFLMINGTRTTKEIIDDQIQTFDWNERSVLAGVRVPILLTNSKYLRKINLRARIRSTKISDFDNPVPGRFEQQNGALRALEYQFQFIRRLRTSKYDINSKWGQTLAVNYKHTPIGGAYTSNQFAIQSNLYFPGIAKHHSIHLRGSFQYEDRKNYRFSSPVTFTRGFGYTSFETYSNIALNYAFPLFYPDIHIGPLLNIQRVYANVFHDFGRGVQDDSPDFDFKSYGAEVSFNFNIMRFLPLLDVGIRYSYLPDFNDTVVQVIIGSVTF